MALDRLEKAGYLRREPNPADRRSLLITLIPTRLRKVAAMYEGVENETRRLLAMLPEGDLEAVIRFFEATQSVRSRRAAATVIRSGRVDWVTAASNCAAIAGKAQTSESEPDGWARARSRLEQW